MPYEIHLYTGSPSAGGVNGTLASEGTELTPLEIPIDGTPATFGLRCDTGRQLTNPSIILSGTGASNLALAVYGEAFGEYGATLGYVGVIQDTNVLFQIKSDGTLSLDDTGVDIQINNGTFANIPTVPVASSLSITGTATIGQVLTGHYTYSDGGGYAEGTSTFRWLRNGSAISAATSITYTLTEADIGTDITFEVTPVNANYSGIPVVSSATSIPVPAPPSLDAPSASDGKITCTFTQNSSFSTESYNAYYTTDGSDPTTGSTKLTGVTSPFDVSATNGLTVKVKLEMVVNSVASALSDVVSGVPVANSAPTASSVNITGTTTIGSTLTGNYTYADSDSDAEGTSTFRWLRNDVAIESATASTYAIVDADIGKTIKFEVTPVAATGTTPGNAVASSGTAIPVPAPPSITVTPGDTQNSISFTANTALTGETYDIYWSTTETTAANIKANGTKIASVTSPNVHSSLTNATQYNYILVMVVNGIDSANSSVASGTPTVTYGSDICTGGTAIADSYLSGYPQSRAFDGNDATEWATNANPINGIAWCGYDFLGASKTVKKVVMRTGYISSVKLQRWTGAAWEDVETLTQNVEVQDPTLVTVTHYISATVAGTKWRVLANNEGNWDLYTFTMHQVA